MMRAHGFDAATMAEALSRPGIDPREWISYATVSPQQQVGEEVEDSVEFDDELGPLVNVKLHPGGSEARCRVGACIAGAGEGEYFPFVEGDEVLVAIPMGDLRAGPVIIARLNNSFDNWPSESIAGQKPTKNTFAFTRVRTPYIGEYAGSYMIRHAKHGAFLLMADSGVITIRDGSKGALQLGPDTFSYMEGTREVGTDTTPSPKAMFQLDLTGRRLTMQVDDAQLMLNSSSADANAGQCYLTSPGEFNVILGTNAAAETVLTLEAFVSLIVPALNAVTGGPAGVLALDAALLAGGSALLTTEAAALAVGKQLAATKVKPPANPALGVQMLPGLGAVLFKTG